MTPLSLQQVCQAVGGRMAGAGVAGEAGAAETAAIVTSICTNSRRMERGSLFVALRGERFDGHEFLAQAAGGGAVAALVATPSDILPCVQVADTRRALGKLAQLVRQGLGGKVIAVAGSNGKTGTKLLIDAALRSKLSGSISPKSYNNDIGVPLTIFAAKPEHDYLVLELGTNHHGEISWLTEIARPDIAVITNCSAEHLEGLTDIPGVRRENAAIAAGLAADGMLVVNGDDPDLLEALSGCRCRRTTFGFASTNDLWASDVSCGANGTRFRLNDGPHVFVPLLGRHAAANALAAIAVGRCMGLPDEAMIDGLSRAAGAEMRLELKQIAGVTVLNDAYNANPASMRAALETLCALPAAGRRVAVLGDMRELGEWTEKLHREIGRAAAKCKLDRLICVGPSAALIAEAATEAGMPPERVSLHDDSAVAAPLVAGMVEGGDLVLLKGSRAVGLEKIAQAIGQSPLRAAG
jgi:UDP-N-acetylmuramoyl-tripeptide--D-alanyl-D-alanine ligase